MTDQSKPFDFVCIGSATQDVFVRSDASKILTMSDVREESRYLCFEYGAKIDVEHIEFTTGGGATNVAVSLARLGARAAFLGKIGPDEIGQLVIRELEAAGVDTSRHLKSEDEATGYSVILTSYEGDRTVLTHRGASTQVGAGEIDWAFVEQAEWLYVTSLSGDSAEVLGPAAERAAAAGLKVAFNPGSTQLRAGLDALASFLDATEVLLLNKEEAARLTGREPVKDVLIEATCTMCGQCIEACPRNVFVRDQERIVAAGLERCEKCGRCVPACPTGALVMEPWAFNVAESFDILCKTGPKVVVITDGENGVQACDGETVFLLPAEEVPVASSLGAGDAFGSAFVFEYSRSGDVGRSLALGAANAASVVQVVGAKNGLLDAAGAAAALERFDEAALRRIELADLLAAAGK
ncbi:MAG: PfkB family carbohydrate kinase [Planctomycetota bacterium]